MNSLGQEFAGFRLLIDAALVLMILVIIMMILGWVNSLRFEISEQRLFDGFMKAVNSPNGEAVMEKGIMLKSGSAYSSATFSKPGIPKECIRFEGTRRSAYSIGSDGTRVSILENTQMDIYYRCQRIIGQAKGWAANCSDDCEICCEISLGTEPEK